MKNQTEDGADGARPKKFSSTGRPSRGCTREAVKRLAKSAVKASPSHQFPGGHGATQPGCRNGHLRDPCGKRGGKTRITIVLCGSTSVRRRQEEDGPRLVLADFRSSRDSAAAGEKCNFEIRVTNTGSATARQLTLSVELPEGLVHEVAQSIEQQIEALAPGQTYRALVRVRARSAGKATVNADVAVGAQVATRLSTAVIVAGATSGSASSGVAH